MICDVIRLTWTVGNMRFCSVIFIVLRRSTAFALRIENLGENQIFAKWRMNDSEIITLLCEIPCRNLLTSSVSVDGRVSAVSRFFYQLNSPHGSCWVCHVKLQFMELNR